MSTRLRGGCPFRTASNATGARCGRAPCLGGRRPSHGRPRTVDLAPLLRGVRLSPSAELIVSVTAPNALGRVWELTLHGRSHPSERVTCQEPWLKTPGRGCRV